MAEWERWGGSAEQWSGADKGWRYLAFRVDGTGGGEVLLDAELPLQDVSITDVDSGPPQITGRISPVHRRLLGPDGLPILDEWSTAIYAEADGVIQGGGLLAHTGMDGPDLTVETTGFSGYIQGMPYDAEATFNNVDPLDVARHLWEHLQAGPFSDVGLIVDPYTTTPYRLGLHSFAVQNGDDTVYPRPTGAEEEKEYRLAWYLTDDMGKEFDDLAKSTPFGYHERHVWNADKTQVLHYLDFGYPSIGRRLDGPGAPRFVLGENVTQVPNAERGGGYANHVRVLGAGEGSAMIRADARIHDGRPRRVKVVDDQRAQDAPRAQRVARDKLAASRGLVDLAELLVMATPSAPLGSYSVGDEVRVTADADWYDFDAWCRVVAHTIRPENLEVSSVRIVRSERLAGAL